MKKSIVLRVWLAVAFASIGAQAAAEPLFGAIASDRVEVALFAGPLIHIDDVQQWSSGFLPVTTVTLPSFSVMHDDATGSGTFIDPSTGLPVSVTVGMSGDASVSGSILNGALHEIASASGTVGRSRCVLGICPSGAVYAEASEQWEDTAFVSGPANVPIVLAITEHVSGTILNGGAMGNGGFAIDQLTVSANNGLFVFGSPQTFTESGPIDFNKTQFLTVSADAVLGINHFFQVDNELYNNVPASETSFGDTSSLFIDVMTPGASLQTASGLS